MPLVSLAEKKIASLDDELYAFSAIRGTQSQLSAEQTSRMKSFQTLFTGF